MGHKTVIPQTVFYDFIYITAVKESFTIDEVKEILSYNYFTDIEFNPSKRFALCYNKEYRTCGIKKQP